MKNKKKAFLDKWQEITDLPPQTVGPLTPAYKEVTKRLKTMPIPLLVLASCALVGALFYLFGSSITKYVTILQRGF